MIGYSLKNLFSFRNRTQKRQSQISRRRDLRVELLETRLAPAVVDLFTAASSGTINGAKYEEVISTSATGTGVFDTFVQLQAGSAHDFDGNSNTEQGVNYDRTGALGPVQTAKYDEGDSGQHNRFVLLSAVPIVNVSGIDYREFFLDVNQLNSSPFLSLDGLIFSVAGSGNLQQTLPNAFPFSYNPTFGGAATLVYDMDVGADGDSTVRMVSFNGADADYPAYTAVDNGSGKGDLRVLIPNSLFSAAVTAGGYATPYVYLFSRFGFTAPVDVDSNVNTGIKRGADRGKEEFFANDGFEEWSVKTAATLAKISIVKGTSYLGVQSDGQSVPEGAAISWIYTVTNTGNVPLSTITVTDNIPGVNPIRLSGDTNLDNILQVTETWIYSASGTAQSAHIGMYTNIGTATGVHNGTTVQATDPSSYTPTDVAPAISIVKTVDANEDGTFGDPESVQEGGVNGGTAATDQKVDYRFYLCNNSVSTDPVTISSISDDRLGSLLTAFTTANGGSAVLAPGACVTFYAYDHNLPVQNAGSSYINTVTVNGTDNEGTAATATDTATVNYTNVNPAIQVVKTSNVPSVREGGVGGDQVIYSFAVTNTSQAGAYDPLHNVTLTDTQCMPTGPVFTVGDTDALLEAGETWTYSCTVTPPVGNATGGSHSNTATVTGLDDENTLATDTDTAIITYSNVPPTIQVVKTSNVPSVREGGVGGDQVIYSFAVTNTSQAGAYDPLHNVTLTDTQCMPTGPVFTVGDTDALLEAGETWTYSCTVTPPVGNATGGSHSNTATVTGLDDENTLATDTDTAIITYSNVPPTISVAKSASPVLAQEAGLGNQSVTYTYTVTNTSPASTDPVTIQTLHDSVLGPLTGSSTCQVGTVLQPGSSCSFQVTTTVAPQPAGTTLTNTFTATGKDDENTPTNTPEATATVNFVGGSASIVNVGPGVNPLGTAHTFNITVNVVAPAGVSASVVVTPNVKLSGTATATPLTSNTCGTVTGSGTFIINCSISINPGSAGTYIANVEAAMTFTVSGQSLLVTRDTDSATAAPAGPVGTGHATKIYVDGVICGFKYHDQNGNGSFDAGSDPRKAGFTIYLDADNDSVRDSGEAFAVTDSNGNYCFRNLTPGTYQVREDLTAQVEGFTWLNVTGDPETVTITWNAGTQMMTVYVAEFNTANAVGDPLNGYRTEVRPLNTLNQPDLAFGNMKRVNAGARTLGFWSNKNGMAILQSSDNTQSACLGNSGWRKVMNDLNLRTSTGADFVVPTGNWNGTSCDVSFSTAYTTFRTWLLNATATNMAYMLSAQLAAMQLNVTFATNIGFTGNQMYTPGLVQYQSYQGNTYGANMTAIGVQTVQNLINWANHALSLSQNAVNASTADRAYLEALKNALDLGNNNQNFVA